MERRTFIGSVSALVSPFGLPSTNVEPSSGIVDRSQPPRDDVTLARSSFSGTLPPMVVKHISEASRHGEIPLEPKQGHGSTMFHARFPVDMDKPRLFHPWIVMYEGSGEFLLHLRPKDNPVREVSEQFTLILSDAGVDSGQVISEMKTVSLTGETSYNWVELDLGELEREFKNSGGALTLTPDYESSLTSRLYADHKHGRVIVNSNGLVVMEGAKTSEKLATMKDDVDAVLAP